MANGKCYVGKYCPVNFAEIKTPLIKKDYDYYLQMHKTYSSLK